MTLLHLFHNQGRGQPIGGRNTYADKVLGLNPIAYWQLNEASGGVAVDSSPNGFDGAYTGVTLGQEGIGDGNTAPLFDGANDFVDVWSTGFRDTFDGSEGTVAIWAKVFNVGVWTDSTQRKLFRFRIDINNRVLIDRAVVNGRINATYSAGGVTEATDINGLSNVNWSFYTITWSKSSGVDGEVKVYLDGSQSGLTDTTLGVWAGNLNVNQTALGAASIFALEPWYGWLAHPCVFDYALSPAQVEALADITP
jgi:hypothetical protein